MAARIGEKAQRAFELLVGLGDPRARAGIAKHGFTEADLDEGWRRLIALSKVPTLVGPPPLAEALAALDAWESRWFPIVEVVLRTSHAPVHERVFLNLRQTDGPQVIVSVKTMLDRLEAIARPEEDGGLGQAGQRARAHLARRGLSDEVIAAGRALLASAQRPPSEPVVDPEARASAEAHLWTWYLEWSGIIRATVKDRRVLAALGLRPRGRKKKKSEG